jgi:hypothetical protein
MRAFPGLVERRLDLQPMTRLRAARAVREITRREFAFDGRMWPPGACQRRQDWWKAIDYRYDAEAGRREAAAARFDAGASGSRA